MTAEDIHEDIFLTGLSPDGRPSDLTQLLLHCQPKDFGHGGRIPFVGSPEQPNSPDGRLAPHVGGLNLSAKTGVSRSCQ
jgi:hypothetical protein